MTFRRGTLVLLACLGTSRTENAATGPTQAGTSDCSTKGQVTFVRDALQAWHYW